MNKTIAAKKQGKGRGVVIMKWSNTTDTMENNYR